MTKVEAGRAGGLASAEAKRRRKSLAAALSRAGVEPLTLLELLRNISPLERPRLTADLQKIAAGRPGG